MVEERIDVRLGQDITPFSEYDVDDKGNISPSQYFDLWDVHVRPLLYRKNALIEQKREFIEEGNLPSATIHRRMLDIQALRGIEDNPLILTLCLMPTTNSTYPNVLCVIRDREEVLLGYQDDIVVIERWQKKLNEAPRYYPVPDHPEIFKRIQIHFIQPPSIEHVLGLHSPQLVAM